MNRHRALIYFLSMIFSENRYPPSGLCSRGMTNGNTARRHAPKDFLLSRLLDEDAILIGRREIDIDAADLVAGKNEEFGITKAPAAFGDAFIGHEGFIAFDKDPFQLVPLDPVAVLPTAFEVGGLVDLVVKGAGETEVVGERNLHRLSVVRHVGDEQRVDGFVTIGHLASPHFVSVHRRTGSVLPSGNASKIGEASTA